MSHISQLNTLHLEINRIPIKMFHKTKIKKMYVIQNWSELKKLPAKKMRLKSGKWQTNEETVKFN